MQLWGKARNRETHRTDGGGENEGNDARTRGTTRERGERRENEGNDERTTRERGERRENEGNDERTRGTTLTEAADPIAEHRALFARRRRVRRGAPVLRVGVGAALGHQGPPAALHLPLVARHQRGVDAAVRGRHRHHDAHGAADHARHDLRAVRPPHAGWPVALADAVVVAADAARRTRGPGAGARRAPVTRRALSRRTARAVAEHLRRNAADVPTRVPLQPELPERHQRLEGDALQRRQPVAGHRQPGQPPQAGQQASGQPGQPVGGQVQPPQPPQAPEGVRAQAGVGVVGGRRPRPEVVGGEVEPAQAAERGEGAGPQAGEAVPGQVQELRGGEVVPVQQREDGRQRQEAGGGAVGGVAVATADARTAAGRAQRAQEGQNQTGQERTLWGNRSRTRTPPLATPPLAPPTLAPPTLAQILHGRPIEAPATSGPRLENVLENRGDECNSTRRIKRGPSFTPATEEEPAYARCGLALRAPLESHSEIIPCSTGGGICLLDARCRFTASAL
ncbi:hypothetical protein EYF80_053792 [Liparis tanakae]|uniref:Uncharacterized protein n=1 Tax=Liparis tanakae TaxID=230148 RepID=A0A4Z2F4I3_9TELE|nr:hypothetical protein EYF80_053792 [Liparis tanakae]